MKGKGAIFRSKVRQLENGEKPTKYFFNTEKRNYNRKIISELKRPDGKTVVNKQEILSEIQSLFVRSYIVLILIIVIPF